MEPLNVGAAISAAWSHFTRRGWYLFGLTIAMIGLGILATGNAATTALSAIILGGYLALLLKHARQEPIAFDDLFDIDRRWIYFAFGTLIKGLLIMCGLLLFIVPGIYLAIRWMFSELYIIDHGMRPVEALRASSELTAGYRWQLFGYLLLVIGMTFLGLLFFGVGVFVAIAVVNLSTIMLFWKLLELQYLRQQGAQQ